MYLPYKISRGLKAFSAKFCRVHYAASQGVKALALGPGSPPTDSLRYPQILLVVGQGGVFDFSLRPPSAPRKWRVHDTALGSFPFLFCPAAKVRKAGEAGENLGRFYPRAAGRGRGVRYVRLLRG